MKKKIVGIFICMLMFASVYSVAAPINENFTEVTPVMTPFTTNKVNPFVSPLTHMSNLLGKTVYGCRAHPSPWKDLVSFTLDNPGTLNKIVTATSDYFLSGGCWVNGIWWCCEYSGYTDNNSKIWKINPSTGEMTLVGPSETNVLYGLQGLAYDDTTGNLYACGGSNLYTIDMFTGKATKVGTSIGHSMVDIACDSQGNLYGLELGNPGELYAINKTNAKLSKIGELGLILNHCQDMAFDKDEDKLYIAALICNETWDPVEGALYSCDHHTAECTKIGTFDTTLTLIDAFAIPYTQAENQPPSAPTITGPASGKPGTSYDYVFNSVDPENNNLRYIIDWGDGNTFTTDSNKSGTDVTVKHLWGKKGTFTIKVKAEDTNNAESDWTTLKVTIPKSKSFNFNLNLLSWLFERYPDLFPLLQKIIQRFGLQ